MGGWNTQMRYETPEHVSAADRVARELERAWNCRISNSLGAQSPFNRLVFDDGPVAWLEIKCRSNSIKTYPTYMISKHKIDAAEVWQSKTTLEVYLAVEFNDALGFINLLTTEYTTGIGGRVDRGNPRDREPCAYFDLDHFTLVRDYAAA
jgi:hypothetical protein